MFKHKLARLAGCLFLSILVLVVSVVFLLRKQQVSSAERICRNLIAANLVTDTNCVDSNWAPDYMPVYFPPEEVSMKYVQKGMQGFEVLMYSTGKANCRSGEAVTVIRYGLRKLELLDYTFASVDFGFCGETLVRIGYHD